jgi:hypothetical protein
MALKQPWAIKTVLGDTDLELKADPGEAFKVLDIFTYDPVADYLTVRIEKTTVGYFRTRSDLGGHQVGLRGRQSHTHQIRTNGGAFAAPDRYNAIVLGDNVDSPFRIGRIDGAPTGTMEDIKDATRENRGPRLDTLLGLLKKMGIWTGWPVAEGETFRLSGGKNPNARQVVIYEIWEPGDIKADDLNGSRSKEYLLVNYGNCGATIKTTGDHLYTTSKNPAEFPDFPFGGVVPAKYEIEILGICGSTFAPKANENANYSYTQFLKLIKDREILFDEDRNGILFEQRNLDLGGRRDGIADGISLIGNYSEIDKQPPLFFDPPLKFVAGEELGVYVTLAALGTGQDITIYQHEIALIERVKRVE